MIGNANSRGASMCNPIEMSPKPSSSATIAPVTAERASPPPPNFSGMAPLTNPNCHALEISAAGIVPLSSAGRAAGRISSRAKAPTLSRIICCSSLSSKSIIRKVFVLRISSSNALSFDGYRYVRACRLVRRFNHPLRRHSGFEFRVRIACALERGYEGGVLAGVWNRQAIFDRRQVWTFAQNLFGKSGHHFVVADSLLVGGLAALKDNRTERIGVAGSKQVLGEDFKPAIARPRDKPMPDRRELTVEAAREVHRGRTEVLDASRAVHDPRAAVEAGDGAEHPSQQIEVVNAVLD